MNCRRCTYLGAYFYSQLVTYWIINKNTCNNHEGVATAHIDENLTAHKTILAVYLKILD